MKYLMITSLVLAASCASHRSSDSGEDSSYNRPASYEIGRSTQEEIDHEDNDADGSEGDSGDAGDSGN